VGDGGVDPAELREQWNDMGERIYLLEQMMMTGREEREQLRADLATVRGQVDELLRAQGRMHTSIHAATLAFSAALDLE
jgi:type VI protein secretion system component VasF